MSFADRFVFHFAATLLTSEAATPLPPAVVQGASAFVVGRIGRLPSLTRFGVRAISLALALAVTVVTGRPLGRHAASRQARVVTAIAARRLPGVGEWVRLVRSLVVVAAYEQRYPLDPAAHP